MVLDLWDTMEGNLLEHVEHCEEGHYDYEYAYGSERIYVFGEEFRSHWTEDAECRHKQDAEINTLIKERKTMKTERIKDYQITYNDSQEAREKLYAACLEWFKDQGHYSGESIMQSDEPQIQAPVFLSDVADDIFQFDQVYDDEMEDE